MKNKRSLFERLSGTISTDDFDTFDDEPTMPHATIPVRDEPVSQRSAATHEETLSGEGQLPVDVYQTANEIVIRAFVAGVRPDELGLSVSRDMVEITGSRIEHGNVSGQDYFTRELFWGSFSRTILLPQEVDVEASSAIAKDGLLTIILPKLDKARQTKLRVKAG